MAIVTPPKILREKLGDDGVDALVDLVNKANENEKEDIIVLVEEKFEKKLMETKTELLVKIEQTKSDLIKWMFVFWVGQTGIIIGIILTLLKAK